ncbi:hypothetical protein A2U01_0108162, partial [Trifolium medium]|nr:hypothetical protein [Trifolium medium]
HEEETCDAGVLELNNELAKLGKRKRELQLIVKEDVAKLLEKRKILLELKSKQATLAADLDRLSNDLATV